MAKRECVLSSLERGEVPQSRFDKIKLSDTKPALKVYPIELVVYVRRMQILNSESHDVKWSIALSASARLCPDRQPAGHSISFTLQIK